MPVWPESTHFTGLYVHVPFCAAKCDYCDFVSVAADADVHRQYVDRVINEMRALAPRASLRTVFVGGGTPTVLGEALLQRLLDAVREAFDLSAVEEFSVEANPETVAADKFATLAAGGVNRLSLGAQSFDERLLRTLGRRHRPGAVAEAVTLTRAAGIDDVNLDLVFGVPGQTLDAWRRDLDAALALKPTHVACYGLTIEPGTPLGGRIETGEVAAPDDDMQAAMYECAHDALSAAGFEHYEISNWARPGRRCRHNMQYWLNANWLALGPAAAVHADGLRWTNTRDIAAYLASRGPAPVAEFEQLDPDRRAGEEIMLRLRLVEGAPTDWLAPRFTAARRAALERHVRAGMLDETATHLRLTRRGLLLADSVLSDLL